MAPNNKVKDRTSLWKRRALDTMDN